MPRKANQSTDWNFKVIPVRMHLPDGRPSNMIANVREDSGWVFGQRSEKGYGLIQNADFISTIREALTGLGLTDFREEILTTRMGANIYATYHFDTRVRTINKVGDKVGLVLRFADSKDCKTAAMGELMAKVLRCLNGMMLEQGQFSLMQRHNANINLDFIKTVIGKAVNEFDAALSLFDKLSDIALTDEQGVNVIKRLAMAARSRESVQTIWINPNFAVSRARTLYSLYDAVTEYLRDVEKDRFEHAHVTNRKVLRQMVQALDPERFAELTAPLPVIEAEVIEINTDVPAAPSTDVPQAP